METLECSDALRHSHTHTSHTTSHLFDAGREVNLGVTEHDLDLEQGVGEGLPVPIHLPGDALQGGPDVHLQGLLHHPVNLVHVPAPVALHVPSCVPLEHLKRLPHGGHNVLVDGLDLPLGLFPVLPLLQLVHAPLVQPLLLVSHQQKLADGATVSSNEPVGHLVALDDLAQLEGVVPAVHHKVLLDPFRRPSQLAGHPWLDLLVQEPYALLEEGQFLGQEAGDDRVVVPHDEEDVLPQHPQVLAAPVDVGRVVRDLEVQPLPVAHLPEQLEEGFAELEFEHAGFLGGPGQKGGLQEFQKFLLHGGDPLVEDLPYELFEALHQVQELVVGLFPYAFLIQEVCTLQDLHRSFDSLL